MQVASRPLRLSPVRTALLLGLLSAAAGLVITHGFSGLLDGTGDTGVWTDVGYTFARDLTLFPFPWLQLVNDGTFYPHGVNHVFTPWTFEANYFYALWYTLSEHGPWLQVYFVLGLAVQCVGMWALLRGTFGEGRAVFAAIVGTLANAYLIHKYPGHFSYSVIHWTVLGIVCDVLLFRRIHERRPISARLVLMRAALAALSLGLELAYVAGYGLVLLTVTTVWSAALAVRRGALFDATCWRATGSRWAMEARQAPWLHGSLVLLLLAATWLYVPLTLQVVAAARSFDMANVPAGSWFSNPLRLVLPYTPWWNPGHLPNLLDRPEGFGAGSPGLTLTLLGLLGLWVLRRRLLCVAPLLTFFALLLLYVPDLVPTLKLFPWMEFNRVGSRTTLVYPAILVLLAVHIDWRAWGRPGRTLLAGLVALGLMEGGVVYAAAWQRHDLQPGADFQHYQRIVRETPGEAVLDWPFCAVGGNGVGRLELCPLYLRLNQVFAFRKHHRKKVLGQYLGRLHPAMIRPYLEDGLVHLVRPHVGDWSGQLRQECLTGAEWDFFDAYFTWYDFAGINLYVDALLPGCADAFTSRFGAPMVAAGHFQAGRMVFIPKDAARRAKRGVGPAPRYAPPLATGFDLATSRFPYGVVVEGMGQPIDLQPGVRPVPLQGPRARVAFALDAARPLRFHYVLASPVAEQSVTIRFNDVTVAALEHLAIGERRRGAIDLLGRAGRNELHIATSVPPRSRMAAAAALVLKTLVDQGVAGLWDIEGLRVRFRFSKAQTLWLEQLAIELPPQP
jgi:hypothetical protein